MHFIRSTAAIAIFFTGLATLPASAQNKLKPFPLGGSSTTTIGSDASSNFRGVKIAVTYQFFIQGPTGSMDEQTGLADKGRKHLYLMLAKECVVLKETIAATCAIERASVNAQLRKQSRSRNNGVRISGSASYQIKLKPESGGEKD